MNVILVVFDTLRQDHIGIYGNDWIQTPHLDAFARESAVFTKCYPDSLPTLQVRRSLHTGKRVFPFEKHSYLKGDVEKPVPGWGPIPEEDETLSEILRKHGYRTFFVTDCYHQFKPSKNFHRGFDAWQLIRGQELDMYKTGIQFEESYLNGMLSEYMQNQDHVREFLIRYKRNCVARHAEEDYFAPQVFREAIRWLYENQDEKKVFMMIDSFDPHEPWDPPRYYREIYDTDSNITDIIQSPYYDWSQVMDQRELKRLQANYAGEVTMCDRWFGFFIEQLKLSGRWKDSIVAVISDHGHNLGYDPGDKGLVSKQGYPMTHAVADLVMMIHHPENQGAGKMCSKLIQNYDLTTTLLHLAGITPPESMEGLNIWPAVLDENETVRDHVITCWGTALTVIRDKWWYNSNLWREEPILNDLEADAHLTTNLAKDYSHICQELHELAMEDAKGALPEYLVDYKDRGGCGLVAWPLGPFHSMRFLVDAK